MKILQILLKAVLVCLSLVVAQMIAGMMFPVNFGDPHYGAWIGSNAISAVALTALAIRAPWRGFRLALILAGIPMVVQVANLVEGVVFLTNAGIDFRRIILLTVAGYVISVPLFFLIFRKTPVVATSSPEEAPLTLSGKIWRFVVSDVSYVILYFVAGFIIFPFVREFYATQIIPPFWKIITLQELFRAPIFIGICLLIKHALRLPRFATVVGVGILFTVLSGVVPLITPNPFFPDSVRWVHFGEVVSSNFLFGMIVTWLWSKRVPALHVATQAA